MLNSEINPVNFYFNCYWNVEFTTDDNVFHLYGSISTTFWSPLQNNYLDTQDQDWTLTLIQWILTTVMLKDHLID